MLLMLLARITAYNDWTIDAGEIVVRSVLLLGSCGGCSGKCGEVFVRPPPARAYDGSVTAADAKLPRLDC